MQEVLPLSFPDFTILAPKRIRPIRTPSMQPGEKFDHLHSLQLTPPFCKLIHVYGVTVGYTAAVEAAMKRGNGNSQHSRQSPDRPVSSVTPTHTSHSGPRAAAQEGKAGRLGSGKELRRVPVVKFKIKLWNRKRWAEAELFISGKLEGPMGEGFGDLP